MQKYESIDVFWLAFGLVLHHKVLKLSHFCSSASSRIFNENSSVRGISIRDGTLTNRQKTLNLGRFFLPSYGQCSHLATGCFCSISNKYALAIAQLPTIRQGKLNSQQAALKLVPGESRVCNCDSNRGCGPSVPAQASVEMAKDE